MRTAPQHSKSNVPSLFSRRNALRLALLAVPAVTGIGIATQANAAEAGAPMVNIIDAVSRSIGQQTLLPGSSQPNASNSGVPAGVSLKQILGDIDITTPGTVVDAVDVHGFIRVRANNARITRSRVHGRGSTYISPALILVSPGVTGTVIEDCEVACDNPQYWQAGVSGSDYTARRCNVHDVIDAFDVDNGNVLIEACYIHHMTFFSNSPNHANDAVHPGWTHNDGVQISGGSHVTIRGNSFKTYASLKTGSTPSDHLHDLASGWNNYGASITCSPDKSPISNLLIELNWFDGGDANFQSNYRPTAPYTLGTIRNNRFGRDQHVYTGTQDSRYQIRFAQGITVNGLITNVWDPECATVPDSLKGTAFAIGYAGGVRIS